MTGNGTYAPIADTGDGLAKSNIMGSGRNDSAAMTGGITNADDGFHTNLPVRKINEL
jgi:hypothetical protein